MSDPKEKRPVIEQGDEGNMYVHDINQDSHDTSFDSHNISQDSHNTSIDSHNQDSHDVINNNTVNQNSTYIYSGEAAHVKRQEEKIAEYRHFCKQNITTRFIDRDLKIRLKDKALALQLDDSLAQQIEEHVIASLSSGTLSQQDIITLELAEEGIRNNDVEPIVNRIVALADNNQNPSVQYYANLILAVEDPRKCIQRYERATYDSYWQMYWVYLAYLRQRNPEKAERVKNRLSDNTSMPEDLLNLLNGAGDLLQYFANNGSESFRSTALVFLNHFRDKEPLVDGFVGALKILVKASRPLYFTGKKEIDFYFRLFCAKQKQEKPVFSADNTAQFSAQSSSYSSGSQASDIYERAREVAQKPFTQQQPVTQPQYPASTSDPDKKAKQKKTLAWILAASVAILVLVKMITSSPNKEEERHETQEPVAEVVEQPVETTTPAQNVAKSSSSKSNTSSVSSEKKSVESSNVIPAQTASSVSSSTPAKETSVSSTPIPESATKTAEPVKETVKPAEMSASELLSQGKTLLKRFKPEQALEYFTQAAAKGSAEANYQLGELYYNGNGVKKSFPTAKSYYKKAADAGVASAQYMMGVMARNGQGGDKDINEAKRWLQKAADQGYSQAEKMLKQL